jgi:Fe/S biogenesis protein NfuA
VTPSTPQSPLAAPPEPTDRAAPTDAAAPMVSPLTGNAVADGGLISAPILTITDAALAELVGLRDAEPDAADLGLRVEIISEPGAEFKYDLSFDTVTTAAFSDEVRTVDGEAGRLKLIVPAASVESLTGATLDHTDSAGLVIRNPNKPQAPKIEGLTIDDEISAQVETIVAAEVNPALAAHGGFVTYVGHDGDGTAYLTMGGGCHGCAMSRMTMLDGVQGMITEQVDGIDRVKDLTDHASGENPFYR